MIVRDHGTNAGYWQHYKRREEICTPCRDAHREYQRQLRAVNLEQRLTKERERGARRRANPDDSLHAANKRNRDKRQADTAVAATKTGTDWLPSEDELVQREDLTIREIALQLRRSAAAVTNRRQWHRDAAKKKMERIELRTRDFTCEVCGASAASTVKNARYCSAVCNQRAHVQRHRGDRGCSVDECAGGGPFTRGMCSRHYEYWRKHGQPLFVVAREHGTIAGYWQHWRRRDNEEMCEPCRIAQNEYSMALYNRDPQRYRDHVQDEFQQPSIPEAHKNGNVWTGPEMELLLRDDLTNRDLAKVLGRTFFAVSTRRSQIRREHRDGGDTKWVLLAGVPSNPT